MNEQMQIATTIREQLNAGGLMKVWRWGGHNWMALNENHARRGGLQFDVTGRKFQGRVQIELHWSDTYNIYLGGHSVADFVYCDMLTDVIDGLVEV